MSGHKRKYISINRKALFQYYVESKIEAGIILVGSEVKSIRAGHISIAEAYVDINKDNMVYLYKCHIAEYKYSNLFAHNSTRVRQLLLRKREIEKIYGKVKLKGYTLIPLSIFFANSLVKVELGVAKGKKIYDKRQTIKDKDWKKEKDRRIKEKNNEY